MSPYSIHLRSDNPTLLVEINLSPGTHARIGASEFAEISLPLAGLPDFAGMIGRTPEGRIYHADPDGENRHHIQLPGALALPPYQFVVFQPSPPAEALPAKTQFLQGGKKRTRQKALVCSAAALAVAVAVSTVVMVADHGTKPTLATSPPVAATPPSTVSDPVAPQGAVTMPTVNAMSAPAVPPQNAAATLLKEAPPESAPFNLEALAQRVASAVFRLEVKDSAGTITGTGTAFAISADGLAVTNFHVVDGGESFTARTTQGAEFAVSGIAATDPAADLALVTLRATNLPFLELGESDSLKIGTAVAVFGAPRGLSGTLSNGILSARRTEPEIEGNPMPNGGQMLQISAPISAGSSGSPVIDGTGKVIGVAAAAFVAANAQNLNFVIPVEAVKKLQRDSVSGIANLREAVRVMRPEPKGKLRPESAFFADPDAKVCQQLAKSGDWIPCLKVAKQLVERHPKSSTAYYFLGYSQNAIGLSEQAELSFKQGLAISPEDGDLWRCLGTAQDAQKKTEAARESWKRAGGIDPENAETWRRLSVSYLIKSEYLDAVSSLENLRNLDPVEFERLLELCRSMHVHPPQLRDMLTHFDNLPDRAAKALTDPEQLASTLVAKFLRHGQGHDIQAELADYAATVNPYFDQGAQQKPAILKDITAYRKKWPDRSLRLLGVESARRDDADKLDVTYRLRFSATDGRQTSSGNLVQGVRFTLTAGRWLVSGVQTIERVAE